MRNQLLSLLTLNNINFLERFIEESDAIEGIKNRPGEIRDRLLRGEMNGHAGAILMLTKIARDFRNGILLNKTLICNIQEMIVSEQGSKLGALELPKKYWGRYRNVKVFVDLRECIEPALVPLRMKFLIEDINQWFSIRAQFSEEEKIKKVADFHFMFEIIHPFVDGNGRTGRALVYYMLLRLGIMPFIFSSIDKAEAYYPCFKVNDSYLMQIYFLKRMNFSRK